MSERESKEQPLLRAPIESALRPAVGEGEAARMWRAIQARRSAARPRGRVYAGASALALAAAALLAYVAESSWRESSWREGSPSAELRGASGAPLPASFVASAEPRAIDLSDGSRIELAPSSAAEVLDNGGDTFRTLLRRGRARFDVEPGGPRRWSIEAGVLTVEVVGTTFVVERSEASVVVEVEHGVVLVRGERVPERAQRLLAGERIEVLAERDDVRSHAALEAPVEELDEAEPPADTSAEDERTPEVAPRAEALAPRVDLDALLEEADEARAAGRSADAMAALERALREAPADPRAAVAAFTLGVLEVESGEPARAAAHFERAARHPAGGALREDAMARAALAWSSAGDLARARAAAAAYEERFPEGRRLGDVRRAAEPR